MAQVFKVVNLTYTRSVYLQNSLPKLIRCCSTNVDDTGNKKVSGFAQAFEKFAQPAVEPEPVPKTFANLLRNSTFIDLGDPEGKVVFGKIYHIVENDLYIDFGWKFHCVCPRPSQNAEKYVRGATVRIRIKDLELSTKFLGSEKDLTILEADAVLLGLVDR